jgi:hypothetical protein
MILLAIVLVIMSDEAPANWRSSRRSVGARNNLSRSIGQHSAAGRPGVQSCIACTVHGDESRNKGPILHYTDQSACRVVMHACQHVPACACRRPAGRRSVDWPAGRRGGARSPALAHTKRVHAAKQGCTDACVMSGSYIYTHTHFTCACTYANNDLRLVVY